MSVDETSDNLKNSLLRPKELAVSQVMQEKLAKHLRLNTLTLDTMAFTVNSFPPTPISAFKQSSKVVLMLLNRMSDDIRTAGLLSSLGYPLQAAALIADCHESAFTVLTVGSDDELGDKWINHGDPKCTPLNSTMDVIRKGYQNLGEPDVNTQTEREYKTYRTLCHAKHSNPLMQKLHGLRVEGNRIILSNGPDASEEAIILASWTLEHAAHLAYLALRGFQDNQIPLISSTKLAEVRERIDILGNYVTEIVTAGIEKYGDTDPFLGKW